MTSDPGGQRALLNSAVELYKARLFPESRAAFNKVIQLSAAADERAESFYGLGVLDFNQGELEAAAANFHQSLGLRSSNANAVYFLGEIARRNDLPEEAERLYRQAIGVDPGHLGARQRLEAARAAAAGPDPGSASLGQGAGTAGVAAGGIYDIIRDDSSPIARQTLALIDSLALSARSRISAFAGPIGVRALALLLIPPFLPKIALSVLHGLVRTTPRGLAAAIQVINLLVIAYLAASIAGYILRAVTSKYVFDRGRLRIATGIFNRSEKNIELYRVEDVSLSQSFVNRLTGDGTLTLQVSSGHGGAHPQKLTGLANIDELRVTFDKLRNLVLLMRTGAWGKGVIY